VSSTVLAAAPAISNGEVILIVALVALPIAGIAFAFGAGNALRQIGKGPLSVEFEQDLPQRLRDTDAESESSADREAEVRQLLEAKAYRQSERGEAPLDVDAELERLLSEPPAGDPGADPALRAEVRQLVIARNERRARQGKPPLEIEAEVERQLRDLEGLGQ
jgi:hypothetical protein